MKATLDELGGMRIISETPLEQFALARWFEWWTSHKATLEIAHKGSDCNTYVDETVKAP